MNKSISKIKKARLFRLFVGSLLTGLFLTGCGAEATESAPAVVQPAATTSALLASAQSAQPESQDQVVIAEPTVASLFDFSSKVELVPTPTKRPLVNTQSELSSVSLGFGTGDAPDQNFVEALVFDDQLDSNWTLENSANIEYDPGSTERWFDTLDENSDLTSGAMSISLKPKADYAQLFFTVRADSSEVYHRDEILGVSFWMYSGADIIDTGDFAVTVVGSNEQRYWSPNDQSVFFQGDDSFSETALYFLDINRAIPAESWIKIEVWLDDLLFDPDYKYMTGVYIKNDAGFRNKVYIDRLTLIKAPGA